MLKITLGVLFAVILLGGVAWGWAHGAAYLLAGVPSYQTRLFVPPEAKLKVDTLQLPTPADRDYSFVYTDDDKY
jgi:hypothetical protein